MKYTIGLALLELRVCSRTLILRFLMLLADLVPIMHHGLCSKVKNQILKAAGMKINGEVFVDSGFRCINPLKITLGNNVSLGHDNQLWAFSNISIGDYTITAKSLLIVAASHDIHTFEPSENQAVEIGSECWIGARVTIIGGVRIGRGCVVGAGALVNKDIPDWSVAVGVPAKVIRERSPREKMWNHFGEFNSEFYSKRSHYDL